MKLFLIDAKEGSLSEGFYVVASSADKAEKILRERAAVDYVDNIKILAEQGEHIYPAELIIEENK